MRSQMYAAMADELVKIAEEAAVEAKPPRRNTGWGALTGGVLGAGIEGAATALPGENAHERGRRAAFGAGVGGGLGMIGGGLLGGGLGAGAGYLLSGGKDPGLVRGLSSIGVLGGALAGTAGGQVLGSRTAVY